MKPVCLIVLAACAAEGPSDSPILALDRPPAALAGDDALAVWSYLDDDGSSEIWQLAFGDVVPQQIYTQPAGDPSTPFSWGPPTRIVLVNHEIYFEEWYDYESRLMRLTSSGAIDTGLGGAWTDLIGADKTFVAHVLLGGSGHDVYVRDPRPDGVRSPWEARYPVDNVAVAIGHGSLVLAEASKAQLIGLGSDTLVTVPYDAAHVIRDVVPIAGGVAFTDTSAGGLYRATLAGTTRLAGDPGPGTLVEAGGNLYFAPTPGDGSGPVPTVVRYATDGSTTVIDVGALPDMIAPAAGRLLIARPDGAGGATLHLL